MIKLTLLNGNVQWFNPHHILRLEATPDTVLHLSHGERWLVTESITDVIQAFEAYQQRIRQPLLPPSSI